MLQDIVLIYLGRSGRIHPGGRCGCTPPPIAHSSSAISPSTPNNGHAPAEPANVSMWANLVVGIHKFDPDPDEAHDACRALLPATQNLPRSQPSFLTANLIMTPNRTRTSTWTSQQLHGEQTGPLTCLCVRSRNYRWQA